MWLHGYTMDASIWEPLWQKLPQLAHVGVDLPGHGSSAPGPRGEDLPALAHRCADLAEAHGARRLVALSFGTLLALQMAIERADAFDALVLGAPGLAAGPQDEATGRRYGELWQLYAQHGPGPHLGELWTRPPNAIFAGARARPELWTRLQAIIGRHRWSEFADGSMRRLATHRQGPAELAGVRARTLLVLGEHELESFKRCAAILQAAVPTVERADLDGLGHLCLIEDPARVAPLRLRWLTR